MKNILLSSLFSLFLLACNNKKAEEPAPEMKPAGPPVQTYYIWQSNLDDSTGKLVFMPAQAIPPDSLQPDRVVVLLNKIHAESGFYSKVQLVFQKMSGDTVYLKIPDATYLTQQMGSSGPRVFLSGLVYTLTGLDGINHVNLDFEEGDHAAPGTYSRESFKGE